MWERPVSHVNHRASPPHPNSILPTTSSPFLNWFSGGMQCVRRAMQWRSSRGQLAISQMSCNPLDPLDPWLYYWMGLQKHSPSVSEVAFNISRWKLPTIKRHKRSSKRYEMTTKTSAVSYKTTTKRLKMIASRHKMTTKGWKTTTNRSKMASKRQKDHKTQKCHRGARWLQRDTKQPQGDITWLQKEIRLLCRSRFVSLLNLCDLLLCRRGGCVLHFCAQRTLCPIFHPCQVLSFIVSFLVSISLSLSFFFL